MPDIKILSDGTISGTQVVVGGKDLTETNLVTEVSFRAAAGWDSVEFRYTIKEPYVNKAGEDQGWVEQTYTYVNGGFEPMGEPKALGDPVTSDAIVGGRILEDVSRQARARRLILGRRFPSKGVDE